MEEPHVVFEIETQVLHAVLEHGDAFNTHAEGESGIFFRVDIVGFQYVRVYHAATHDFEPSRALADVAALAAAEVARHVDLGRRFGEGKVRRAHADHGLLAEDLLGEVEQRLLHVGERDALVDVESFDLVEDAVRAVRNGLVAEHTARADDADGRFLTLHRADLDRRGVRAQQDVGVLLDEERVLHVARGVFGREVQGREDVPVVFDLGSVGHGVAQPRKDLDDLVFHQRDRVARTEVLGRAGARQVARRRGLVGRGVLQLLAQRVDALRGLVFETVQLLAQFAFQFGGYRLELLHQGGQLAFLAENPDAELLDFGGGFRLKLLDTSQEFIDFVSHILIVFLFCLLLNDIVVTCKVIKKLRYVA